MIDMFGALGGYDQLFDATKKVASTAGSALGGSEQSDVLGKPNPLYSGKVSVGGFSVGNYESDTVKLAKYAAFALGGVFFIKLLWGKK